MCIQIVSLVVYLPRLLGDLVTTLYYHQSNTARFNPSFYLGKHTGFLLWLFGVDVSGGGELGVF